MNTDNGNLSSLVQQVALTVVDDSAEQDNGGSGAGDDNADDGAEEGDQDVAIDDDPAETDDGNVGNFDGLFD